jgi:GT2 family glycosyltransferase
MIVTGITVAIPTYGRDQVLADTIEQVLAILPEGSEFIIVDQTPRHTDEVERFLSLRNGEGRIRWLRSEPPSITQAMNRALREARSEVVLFLDDDIRPDPGLIAAHLAAHRDGGAALVAGRVIQPWQEGIDFSGDRDFHFATLTARDIDQFMGGNFSIRRDVALAIGGFDENFVKVAYNFEAEFAYRLRQTGHRIRYRPDACIHHLKIASGGTRSFGTHLTTLKPDHSVGAYYYHFRTWRGAATLGAVIGRPFRAIATRHHLLHPWWIPATLIAEFRGLAWAARLALRGPRTLSSPGESVT